MTRLRYTMFVVTAVLVLALSAVTTAPALADDSIPPSSETPSVENPPTEETAEVPAIAAEPAPAESAIPDLLASAPEGTGVVLLDEAGEAIPLVAQEAVEALYEGDPMWCPAGVTPGGAGCSTNYGSLQALTADVGVGFTPAANGVIWIQNFTFPSVGAIEFDASTSGVWTTWSNFSLTLKGGWSGTGTTITNTPSTIQDSLSILGWNGDITLSDIIFANIAVGSTLNNAALNVQTTKKIALTNVDVTANTGVGTVNGAYLNNLSGAASDVVITNSTFTDNKDYGLTVYSNGAITITNLVANGNSTGVYLDNDSAATAKPVTISGNGNQAKFNGESGLVVYSNGTITINSLTTNNNMGWGAYLDNDNFVGGSAPVKLTGTNTFNNNDQTGLDIRSDGAVTINNAVGNQNGGYGLYVNNSGSIAPQPVTLSVSGGNPDTTFNENWTGNMVILSKGAISIAGLNANNSGNGNGVLLQNNYSGATGGVTLSGWGASSGGNFGNGLTVLSKGAITITSLWTWSNGGGYGALLDNTAGIAPIKISSGTGHWSNADKGLIVYSKGTITLNNVTADNNGAGGVVIDNTYSGTAAPQNITLTGSTNVNNNQLGDGLGVWSYGAISVTNLNANDNQGLGAVLDNCLYNTIILSACATGAPKPVTLNGDNSFRNNWGSGLEIYSKGIITVNNVNANWNGAYGAFLQNDFSGASGAVNVKNTAGYWPSFNNNGWDGLNIFSNGAVTLMDLDVIGNGQVNFVNADNGDPIDHDYGFGLYIDNRGGTGSVTIGTSRANWQNGMLWNFQSGLTVLSNSVVTLSNMDVRGNGGYSNVTGFDLAFDSGYGAFVDNSGAASPKAIMLKGSNTFSDNYDSGLWVLSKGAITLNNVDASGNWGDPITSFGVLLDNSASGTLAPQNITITGFNSFYDNAADGLNIYTYGGITLNAIDAGGNDGVGAYLDNSDAVMPKPVTLNGDNSFNENGNGLTILSKGAIKVNNLNANDNAGNGVLLNNSGASAPAPVTLTGGAYTSGNGWLSGGYGLTVQSMGAISVTVGDIYVGNNSGDGWVLDNAFVGAIGGVTLTSPNTAWAFDFDQNDGNGLTINSLGSIKIAGLDAYNNGGSGAVLNNAYLGSVGTVTITTSEENSFNGNGAISGGDGLLITSNRAITVTNLYAADNGNAGVILNNTFSGSSFPQNIVLNGYGQFFNNGDSGLVIKSLGLITVSNLIANDNGQNNFYNDANALPINDTAGWGVYLDNCGYDSLTSLCTSTAAPKAITLSGSEHSFYNNFQDGLWVTSLGAIKINQLAANGNWGRGAYLDNQWTGSVGGVTITTAKAIDTINFESNGGTGLVIYSHGAITLASIWANGNSSGGTYLDTYGMSTPQNVVLAGIRNSFNNNQGGDGLIVMADGNITINNLTANGNVNGSGATLDNCLWNGSACDGSGNITLTGMNTFSNNLVDGLYADSHGAIIISKVTADNNLGRGVYAGADGSITVACGSMTNNGSYGWWFQSLLNVTLKGVFASGNNGGGANTNLTNGTLITVRACP